MPNLMIDIEHKTASLMHNGNMLVSAQFAYDPYESTAVVSNLKTTSLFSASRHENLFWQHLKEYVNANSKDDNTDIIYVKKNAEVKTARDTNDEPVISISENQSSLWFRAISPDAVQNELSTFNVNPPELFAQQQINVVTDQNALQDHSSQIRDFLLEHTSWAKLWEDAFDLEHVQGRIASAKSYMLTDNKNQVIGFLRVLSNNDACYISNLVVHPDYQRKHLATSLLMYVGNEISQTNQYAFMFSMPRNDKELAIAKGIESKFGINKPTPSLKSEVSVQLFGITATNSEDNKLGRRRSNSL